jgi:hypothetical protein
MEKDRDNYMKQLMDMFTQGGNIAQNMYGIGANAANNQSQQTMNQGDTQATLGMKGQQAGPEMLAGMGKGALSLLMQYLTGGMGNGGFGRGSLTPENGYSGGSY